MTYPARLLNEGQRVVASTRTQTEALLGPVRLLVVVALAALWFVVRPLVAEYLHRLSGSDPERPGATRR